jgi:hypothetical protein
MVVLAKNLYFHAMADNRGAIVKLTDRAAEEDIKEDLLLYSVLSKEPARDGDLAAIDKGIEGYLQRTFGVRVDFDLHDALGRLADDGLLGRGTDGRIRALDPRDGAKHLDGKWDLFLDTLTEPRAEGREFDGDGKGG